MSPEQAMHAGAMQSASGNNPGALEHADDAPDGTARALAFDAQNLLGKFGGDGPAAAAIGTVLREQSLKAAVAISVIPGFEWCEGKAAHRCRPAVAEAARPLPRNSGDDRRARAAH
jgi:hypothetical protein